MVVSVASGKGGTGKTTIAVNLFLACASLKTEGRPDLDPEGREVLDGDIAFLDCDVEGPNAHIFLKPRIEERLTVSVRVPRVEPQKCSHCGICAQVCSFNAVLATKRTTLVLERLCHGCGACVLFCPQNALVEEGKEIGTVEVGTLGPGFVFAHGILKTGEVLTSRVIAELKRRIKREGLTIIDAPPGASCPMVEAVKGSDFCILVTEPTPFGLHDLSIAVEVVDELGISAGVVVNRSDDGDRRVFEFCQERRIPVLLEIPFDRGLMEAYAAGYAAVRWSEHYLGLFKLLFERVVKAGRRRATREETRCGTGDVDGPSR